MRMIRYYGMEQERQVPVIPLPNPGEGGPVYEGMEEMPENNDAGMPPAEAPQMPQIPVIPLPNPGEGTPAFPGPSWKPTPSYSPNIQVRFVNAANGFEAFSIYLNNRMFVNGLAYKETTEYETVAKGDSIVSLVGPDGYVYYQKPYRFTGCRNITIVILNTGSNLELLELPEHNCK